MFTIPRPLRGLFERERKLLGTLSRCAYEAVRKTVAAALDRKDVVPGFVASIQTFGAYGPNFHPHIHAIVSDRAFTPEGEFLPCEALDRSVVEEVFRHEVIARLHRAQRLSDTFRDSLLSWVHSGFTVFSQQAISPGDGPSLERLARYMGHPKGPSPIRLDAVEKTADGKVRIITPQHPQTGATEVVLDPLDWMRAITSQIPDPRKHLVRYYGAYASRTRDRRRRRGSRAPSGPGPSQPPLADEGDSAFSRAKRRSWARLLRKLLEVDPLLCARCGARMQVIAVITDPRVIDRILRHLRSGRGHDPFESRAPPVG